MLLILLLAIVCMPSVYAQTDTSIESLLESVAQDTDVSPELDAVDYFMAHPLPLRQATAKELLLIPGFSTATARAIIRLARTDTVQHCEQIAAQLALSDEQLQLLLLCTTLEAAPLPVVATYRARYRTRLNPVRGFEENSFTGSPLALYQRLTTAFSHVEASIAADKDAGEQSVFDFAGGYIYADISRVQLLLGDYTVQSGMGTTLGRLFGSRKGGNVIAPAVHSRTGIIPQRSAMEQNFFRGIALAYPIPLGTSDTLAMALWFSSLRRAATIDTATGAATSLDADGYFRTEAEIARRGTLGEQAAGWMAEWQSERFSLGASALNLRYSTPLHSSSRSVLEGAKGVLLSLHGIVSTGGMTTAAEVARDASGYISVRTGLEYRIGALQCALSFRSFPPDFRSPFGSSFGESTQPANETGLYIGCTWRASSALRISLYADIYHTPGPTFTVPVPVRGLDFSGEAQLAISRNTTALFRLRREDKTDAMSSEAGKLIFQNRRLGMRVEITHDLSDSLRVRFRCEAVHRSFDIAGKAETGLLCFLEARYRLGTLLSAASRIALYNTDSFSSAIWAYEQTVPGAMSSPAHYGGGMRCTALLQYRPTRAVTMSLFVGITAKNNVESLGSGLMEVEGNTERQVSVQVDVRW